MQRTRTADHQQASQAVNTRYFAIERKRWVWVWNRCQSTVWIVERVASSSSPFLRDALVALLEETRALEE